MGCGKSKERSQGPAPGPPHLLGRARPALRPGGGPPKMEAYEECAGKPGPGAWAWLGGDGAVVAVAAEWEVLEGVYREAGGVPLDGTAAPEGRRVRRTRGGGYAVYGGADGTDHLLPAPGGVEGWVSLPPPPPPPPPWGAARPPLPPPCAGRRRAPPPPLLGWGARPVAPQSLGRARAGGMRGQNHGERGRRHDGRYPPPRGGQDGRLLV
jgi:hypothetical protein